MKKLSRIGFDQCLLSLMPIISWFLISMLVDKNLINIFTLTYPFQFIYYILKSIFSTGANISKEKDKNRDAVMTGLIEGTIIAIIIFLIILFNIENYINFMNLDVKIYKTFTIYSIIQIFISLEFSMMLNKLYFEDKTKVANCYTIIFNLLNFIILIGMSILTNNQVVISIVTLISLFAFTLYIFIKNFNKFKFKLDILKCIKYDSVELFSNISFFLIFFFGLSNAFSYGIEYTTALTFISLITDTQWDTATAIVTMATIDISKNNFNYKESKMNAYKLILFLLFTSFLMFCFLYKFYNLNIKITLIYFVFEIITYILYPIYKIKTCFLQLEWSATKITSNKIVSSIIRTLMSFMKTPFCTAIGQLCSCTYQFITTSLLFKMNYKVDDNGYVKHK